MRQCDIERVELAAYRAGLLRAAEICRHLRGDFSAQTAFQRAIDAIEREANAGAAPLRTAREQSTDASVPAPAVPDREVSDATWALGWNAALDFLILEAGRIGITMLHVTSIASFKKPYVRDVL